MSKKIDLSQFDERVVERNIANNKITKADYEKHLSALPDESDNLAYTVIKEDEDDDDFEDEIEEDLDDDDDDDDDDDNEDEDE